ncbi:V-type ATP synthase subunit D [Candidatus Woesearchaeota archaeon]|nr:V-type ATP synthase subunit D [Candidatus Woesearchaeota archaeon]
MADIKPTRSEYMKLKNKIKLAKSGHKLLKKKRDGLIIEFFELLKKTKNVREELTKHYLNSLQKMNTTRLMMYDYEIKSLVMSIPYAPEFEVGRKNLLGVIVPTITRKSSIVKTIAERGYGIFNSPSIDEACESYERLMDKILEVAEIETAMRKILEEIEKTKRRVNALEFDVIPRMERQAIFVRMRLEEMERESFGRLKRIKAKSGK